MQILAIPMLSSQGPAQSGFPDEPLLFPLGLPVGHET